MTPGDVLSSEVLVLDVDVHRQHQDHALASIQDALNLNDAALIDAARTDAPYWSHLIEAVAGFTVPGAEGLETISLEDIKILHDRAINLAEPARFLESFSQFAVQERANIRQAYARGLKPPIKIGPLYFKTLINFGQSSIYRKLFE